MTAFFLFKDIMATNEPQTIWQDTNGLTEFSSDGPNYIVDMADFYLVDTAGFYVTDTGVTANLIPSTVWVTDDSL